MIRGLRKRAHPERHFDGLLFFPITETAVYKMPCGDSIYQKIAEQKDCVDAAFDAVTEILVSVNNSQYSNAENEIEQLLKDIPPIYFQPIYHVDFYV